jgi:hypothetical protein
MTVIIDGTSGVTYPSNTTQNTAYQTRFKNRFINGGMTIAQRANSATVTSGTGVPTASTGYPAVDRWFVYSTGANVTAAQVAGSNNTQNVMQITGAASVTVIGVGQRIENNNSYDLAGQTVTLSVNMSNSLLTNVTWTASYANTSNTFGTIGTPTKTQISTGTFTVNSTITQYSTQIAIPAAATTGIEILFSVGAQTSGTWVIGNAQLEVGSSASAFEYVDCTTQLSMCQRYYEKSYDIGTAVATSTSLGRFQQTGTSNSSGDMTLNIRFCVAKRATPTMTAYTTGGTSGSWRKGYSGGAVDATLNWEFQGTGGSCAYIAIGAGFTASNTEGQWVASAEL